MSVNTLLKNGIICVQSQAYVLESVSMGGHLQQVQVFNFCNWI